MTITTRIIIFVLAVLAVIVYGVVLYRMQTEYGKKKAPCSYLVYMALAIWQLSLVGLACFIGLWLG